MPIVYRTTDMAKWGAGKGSNLTPGEVDLNFWTLDERMTALEAEEGVGIQDITQPSSTTILITLTDNTTRGPFTLPVAEPTFRGEWAAATAYAVFDIFTYGKSVYQVLVAHTSAATFDPGADDGLGNDLYGLWFSFSAAPDVRNISASSYTATIEDAYFYLRFTNVSLSTFIIPTNAAVPYPIGTELHGRAVNAPVQVEGDSGVTVNPQDTSLLLTRGAGSTFTVKKVAANEWDAMGRFEFVDASNNIGISPSNANLALSTTAPVIS